MDGFAECFMAAEKSSQAMRHVLSKCSSSMAGSSCQNAPSSQQPVKAMQSWAQPQPKSDPKPAYIYIQIQGGGLSIYSPALRTLSSPAHFYEVCGCRMQIFLSEADGLC